MTTHAPTCPVAAPDWQARYSNHDFDCCTCHVFRVCNLGAGVSVHHLPGPPRVVVRDPLGWTRAITERSGEQCQ